MSESLYVGSLAAREMVMLLGDVGLAIYAIGVLDVAILELHPIDRCRWYKCGSHAFR